jgi:nucleoside-diphosphate-sugar epimerase
MIRIAVTGGSGFIGTNMIEYLLKDGDIDLLSLDVRPPKEAAHQRFWTKCDILDKDQLTRTLQEFKPTHIIHFAGRTDMDGKSEEDYAANHVGTENLIAAIQTLPTVERVIFTSSQFVVGPGKLPTSDSEFRPHTIYGQSKVLSEQAIRKAELSCIWTIVRPTNVWGKWHPRYPNEFWRVLKQGRYVHPGGKGVTRCYAYVGNVVEQVSTILAAPPEVIDREVFYVGDAPIDLWDWTNAFSMELVGGPVKVVPRPVVRVIAKVGDGIIAVGGKFPIFTSRYQSMTQDYVTPMEKTFERLGTPRIGLVKGVKETVEWLRTQDEFWR